LATATFRSTDVTFAQQTAKAGVDVRFWTGKSQKKIGGDKVVNQQVRDGIETELARRSTGIKASKMKVSPFRTAAGCGNQCQSATCKPRWRW
jgi:uncharacterized protein YajQ (UPF0234 family)